MGTDTFAVAGTTRVDRDVLTRFATSCLALGLSVDGRRRPADLDAALGGFLTLTRIAGEHCDAWTGLAAAGAATPDVVEAIWRTVSSAGVLQQALDLAELQRCDLDDLARRLTS